MRKDILRVYIYIYIYTQMSSICKTRRALPELSKLQGLTQIGMNTIVVLTAVLA